MTGGHELTIEILPRFEHLIQLEYVHGTLYSFYQFFMVFM